MTGALEEYIAVSIVYFIMCALAVTKACPSNVGKVILSVMFSITYGVITAAYASSLK